jgi:hypothetical protein
MASSAVELAHPISQRFSFWMWRQRPILEAAWPSTIAIFPLVDSGVRLEVFIVGE